MRDVVLIAAMDANRAIGVDGQLPWHLPDDLKRFKRLTMGHAILMGRRTAQAIGRALPGRENLVLTRGDASPVAGMAVVHSLDEALARGLDGGAAVQLSEGGRAKKSATRPGEDGHTVAKLCGMHDSLVSFDFVLQRFAAQVMLDIQPNVERIAHPRPRALPRRMGGERHVIAQVFVQRVQ